jgi:tRNA (cytidine/uridine-2'-O-)-methyltransferase
MIHVALLEPEIPPNTGNIARLCAANGLPLHLVGRLGFRLNDPALKRAGLDYWQAVDLRRHDSLEDFENSIADARVYCYSAHAKRLYTSAEFKRGDYLLFGSETRGLPAGVMERHGERVLRIPMLTQSVRSLNLATAVGIAVYEALRQVGSW